ncbi:hypothetical protein J6590_107745, partial [Homalodisca vitripennis]
CEHLPHEVNYLEPVLKLLEEQDTRNIESWQTSYGLILWLCTIVSLPFDINGFSFSTCGESVSDRLLDTCFIYLMCNDACREVADFLSARVLTRKDMKQHINLFVNWAIEILNGKGCNKDSWDKIGPLEGLAMQLKHGEREDLLPHASRILICVVANKHCTDSSLTNKFATKIITRIGIPMGDWHSRRHQPLSQMGSWVMYHPRRVLQLLREWQVKGRKPPSPYHYSSDKGRKPFPPLGLALKLRVVKFGRVSWHWGYIQCLQLSLLGTRGHPVVITLIFLIGSLGRWTANTRFSWEQNGEKKTKTETQEVSETQPEELPIEQLRVSEMTPMEEDRLLLSEGEVRPEEPKKKRLSRGELQKRRIEEAVAREKNRAPIKPYNEAGSSKGNLVVVGAPEQGKTHSVPPQKQQIPSYAGVKRLRSQLTPEEQAKGGEKRRKGHDGGVTIKTPETYAEMISVEKLAIVRLEHPEVKLLMEEANNLKKVLGKRAFKGKNVTMSRCHVEGGAIVVGCVNTETKEGLEKQVYELSSFEGVPLKMGPAKSLVKIFKVSTFIPNDIEVDSKQELFEALKNQNDLDTDIGLLLEGNIAPTANSWVFMWTKTP